ncbi:uncharacterized protein LOC143292502 [Babylonia areolata]|uniref:uncharacterized protein LOC143292502 n=1 Tax=Babylonia areolata TaxID=304850 RepID=UPI003FD16F5D
MGKDKEMSKEELAEENDRLTAEVSRLKAGLEEVQEALRAAREAYQQSKAAFSLARYGQLKGLIKQLTSQDYLKQVQSLTENQADSKAKGGGGGMVGLMKRAREFAAQDGGAAPKDQPDQPPKKEKGGGKLSGLVKRIKHATGFSDEPPDVRCLAKEDIRRDNERKRREVQRLTGRGLRAHSALQRLHERYQASKKHAPPTRYQELKDMIKDVLAEQI